MSRDSNSTDRSARSARSVRWTARGIVGIVVGGLMLMIASGFRRMPTPQAEGTSVFGQVMRPPSTRPILRVGTFNIQSGYGLDHRTDLDRTAACIRDCDLVGLNEVAGPSFGEVRSQAQILGEKVGLAWLYAPSESRWWHDHWGNGMLTALPVQQWLRFPLHKTKPSGYRSLLLSRQEFGGKMINVLITHTDGSEDREAQLRTVIAIFRSLEEPAILMGDFNTPPGDPQLVELSRTPGVSDALESITGKWAGHHGDWIFVKGFRVLNAGVNDSGASDHPFYHCELELK